MVGWGNDAIDPEQSFVDPLSGEEERAYDDLNLHPRWCGVLKLNIGKRRISV